MAVWSEVSFQDVVPSTRFDAEFYQPHFLHYAALTQTGAKLETQAAISHPTEVVRIYEEEGIQIMLAQNVRANRLDFSHTAFMAANMAHNLRRNLLQPNDVVMTRSGANYGDTAVYRGSPIALYACADVLILRPKEMLGGYLSTFFNTKIGRALLDRGAYGAAQPHIAPNYLNNLRVPHFPNYEKAVDETVEAAYAAEARALELYTEAETLLLDALGLNNLDATHAIAYERNFREVARAGRFDAQYFQPKYTELMSALDKASQYPGWSVETIGELSAPLKYGTSSPLEYISSGVPFLRIADVVKDDFDKKSLKHISAEQAIAEKGAIVRTDDVIVSRSGTLGLTIAISNELDGAIFGSYFIRTRPNTNKVHPLYLSLFTSTARG